MCLRVPQARLHGLPDAKRHGMADASVRLRIPRELRVSTSGRGAHRGTGADVECVRSQTNPDAVAWVISMGISDGQRRLAADLLARVPRCGFMGSQTTKDVARLI